MTSLLSMPRASRDGTVRVPSDEVREAANRVAAHAEYVSLTESAVAQLARRLVIDSAAAWKFRNDYHFWGERDDVIAYILTLSALNFGSGYAPCLRRPSGSTYYTVAGGWTAWFERLGRAPAPHELIRLTGNWFAEAFDQDYADPRVRELMDAYAINIRRLGQLILAKFGGSYANVLVGADFDAQRLVASLCDEPPYRDYATWRGCPVPFHKRVQLLAADLARAGREGGWFGISGVETLTLFADNAVAQVLASENVLTYAPTLAAAISAGAEIPAGSAQETEIRACSIAAAERMLAHLRQASPGTTIIDLDYALWDMSHRPPYSDGGIRRHLTRTLAY